MGETLLLERRYEKMAEICEALSDQTVRCIVQVMLEQDRFFKKDELRFLIYHDQKGNKGITSLTRAIARLNDADLLEIYAGTGRVKFHYKLRRDWLFFINQFIFAITSKNNTLW